MSSRRPLVIVLNWNGGDELIDCLRSLEVARQQGPSSPFDVLLVDNGSAEGAFPGACAQFPWVQVMALPRNLYWAGGNNAAVEWALGRQYSWLVFCNSDIVVDPRWADALARLESRQAIGAVGFRVFGEYSRVPMSDFWRACGEYSGADFSFEDDFYISGCFLAVRAECFRQLGLFDSVYRMYAEEDDFLVRVRMAGWRTVRCNAPIWHASEVASRRIPLLTSYFAIRNTLRLSLKFGPRRLRSSLGFVLRVFVRMVDVSQHVDWVNSYQRRLKPSENLLVNISILAAACLWNLWHLPQTFLRAHRDQKAARQANP